MAAEDWASLAATLAGEPAAPGNPPEPEEGLSEAEPGDAVWLAQSIPQHVMVAGLLAASRIKPVAAMPSERFAAQYARASEAPLVRGSQDREGFSAQYARAHARAHTRAERSESPVEDAWASGVARLQHMPPLDGFSAAQWVEVQLGCAALLENWGAEMLRLGWSTEDAFGIHPEAPLDAIHACGLGVLLRDGKVVAMTEKGAQVQTRSGVGQSFGRKPMPWSVPIWSIRGNT